VLYSLGLRSLGENQVDAFSDPTHFNQADVVKIAVSDYMRCSKKGAEAWYVELELKSGTKLRYHHWDQPSRAKDVVREMEVSFAATEGKDKPNFMRKLPDYSRGDQVWHTFFLVMWVGLFGTVLYLLLAGGYKETVEIDMQAKVVTVTQQGILGQTIEHLAVGLEKGVRFKEVKKQHVLNRNKFDKQKIHELRYGIELVYNDRALVVDKAQNEKEDAKWKSKKLGMGELTKSQEANESVRKQLQDCIDAAAKKSS